ncbi:hypothetical protein [Salinisphaera aquimarina]|uniref:Lipoprotein n=1 Tax=Salinisphaera aquimarina TaxID=2094031 RepID=A0ABV7EKV5_9GAMM
MRGFPQLIGLVMTLGAVVLLGGCAFLRGSAAGSAYVQDDMRHLRLPGAAASGHQAVAYRSPFEYQEYDRSHVDGRAEALFIRATASGTAVDLSSRQLESLTRLWAFNRQAGPLEWEPARAHELPGAGIDYRLYRHRGGAGSRSCMAFIRTWALQSLDPLNRPRRAYFGYFCRPPGQTLSTAAAEHYLRRLTVASPPLLGFHLGQAVPRDPTARAHARGSTSPDWGIATFPLNRLGRYPIGGASSPGH